MSLSDKIEVAEEFPALADVIHEAEVKEFIQKRNNQLDDFISDILDLIEITNDDKPFLIMKMRRLCKAHKEELNKEAGEKLIK